MSSRQYFCKFPQSLISEPLISHTLGAKFGVVPNIRAATISATAAHVVVQIEGAATAIQDSVAYLIERGVEVQEIQEGDAPPEL
ncbi:NIL domain protein [Planctomycetes bacterium Poly30]|uniref:NIL domain protein n=1 Tax=Saltatorellus ferox TaxID=2528018 RepID=A0A518ESK2_9BACT|nr:NIL domain protein [Planctomycetes bacterium Poly30]